MLFRLAIEITKRKRSRVKLCWPFLILCLAPLYVIGCGNTPKAGPPSTVPNSATITTPKSSTTGTVQTQTNPAPSPPAPNKAVIDVSAFIAEFDANPSGATSKYKGQSVELTGPYIVTILARGTNTQPPYMMLAPLGGDNYAGTFVKCYTSSDEAKKYYTGQQIRVDGTVDGIEPGTSGIINMRDCIGK